MSITNKLAIFERVFLKDLKNMSHAHSLAMLSDEPE